MKKEFYCKGKPLADYLLKHGSKLVDVRNDSGIAVYIFEYDHTIDENLDRWELDRKKWLF